MGVSLPVRRFWVVVSSVLIMMVFTGGAILLMIKLKPPKPEVGVDQPRFKVAAQMVVATTVQDRIVLPAMLRPWLDVTLSARQPGRITEVNFEEGDLVNAGDVVARVERELPLQQLMRAEVELDDALQNEKRWRDLHASKAVSDKAFDDSRFRVAQARIAVKEAREVLDQCEVPSSVKGVVETRMVDPGEHAVPGTPLLRVVTVDRLKLSAAVAERDVFHVKPGLRLSFYIDALPGREFTGEVIYVAAVANPGSNTFRVDLAVDNADGQLRAGLIARLLLPRGAYRDVVAVPLETLVPWKGQFLAYVVNSDAAERRVVRLKAIVDTVGIVDSGIAVGETLVVAGQRSLADGAVLDLAGGSRGESTGE